MSDQTGSRPRYSLIVPVFNEQAVLPMLLLRLERLLQELDGPAEAIFVDDGSSDCSPIVLRQKAKDDARFRYIGLSRNFGHQVAITAGMDAARGDAIIVMDADLQDPPEVIGEMIARWKDGYEVVYGRRLSREGESRFKTWTASLFYRLLARLSSVDIPRDTGDFRLVDRKVLEAFRAMPERDRFVRGMFAWLGFKQTEVAFHRLPRPAGETKYSLFKMLRLAVNGVVGFSDAPLRLAIWAGFAVSACAALYALTIIVRAMSGDSGFVVGWASTITIVSFLSGINMILTGLMGLYIGSIYNEVKRRPLYVVREEIGGEGAVTPLSATGPRRSA
jgi:dolichol-phosphate mannosyltransferase